MLPFYHRVRNLICAWKSSRHRQCKNVPCERRGSSGQQIASRSQELNLIANDLDTLLLRMQAAAARAAARKRKEGLGRQIRCQPRTTSLECAPAFTALSTKALLGTALVSFTLGREHGIQSEA